VITHALSTGIAPQPGRWARDAIVNPVRLADEPRVKCAELRMNPAKLHRVPKRRAYAARDGGERRHLMNGRIRGKTQPTQSPDLATPRAACVTRVAHQLRQLLSSQHRQQQVIASDEADPSVAAASSKRPLEKRPCFPPRSRWRDRRPPARFVGKRPIPVASESMPPSTPEPAPSPPKKSSGRAAAAPRRAASAQRQLE